MYVMSYKKPRHKSMHVTLNAASRAHHGGTDVHVVLALDNLESSLDKTRPGYRKVTTDEYVGVTYFQMCFGKGLYYQASTTTISMGLADAVALGAVAVESLDADTIDPYVATWEAARKEGLFKQVLPDWKFESLMFHAIWVASNTMEVAAAWLLTTKSVGEIALARAVLERKIVI